MVLDDLPAVEHVLEATREQDEGHETKPLDQETLDYRRRGLERFIANDPGGAWVAREGGRVVGMANAIRRGTFWGLSMLFVEPPSQSRGIGGRLIDAALTYARGAEVRMIMSSADPRAQALYSRAGLSGHPVHKTAGLPDLSEMPRANPARLGDVGDLGLAAGVDAGLRRSRAADVEHMLGAGNTLRVIDGEVGQGFTLSRGNRLRMLGASDDETAALLLWSFLGTVDAEPEIWGFTAAQQWAVEVVGAAGLQTETDGALFVDGREPPGPWLPSGWYF
jgi:GNAT superfamily N-acetyltransferase